MTAKILNGDCLELMKDIPDESIDLLFCDLPYGQTSCSWDCEINLNLFWEQVNRICKERTPMFFCCSTKFGVSLINSNPKNFRYDLVWVKSAPVGFLLAKKMPMRKHEMLYVFYRKLPLYDLSSHKHKFIIEDKIENKVLDNCYGENAHIKDTTNYNNDSIIYGNVIRTHFMKENSETLYDPPLPNSVIRETTNYKNDSFIYGNVIKAEFMRKNGEALYDPPLPNSMLDFKSEKGKHATQKPVELIKWILKYYSREGDIVLDPTMGSGSTGIACKEMNRKFIGIEKDEKIYNDAKIRLGL